MDNCHLKRPEQTSVYYLEKIRSFRTFIDLSERHWLEEFQTYTKANSQDDDNLLFNRYAYRNDLSASLQEAFPQYQNQAYLIILMSFFEDYLNQLCLNLMELNNLKFSPFELHGTGIQRSVLYLKKGANMNVPDQIKEWKKIVNAQDIRNIIVHNAGHLDKQKHKKQNQIVADNEYLSLESYTREHLVVKKEYLLEVVAAMEYFVDQFCINNGFYKKSLL